jgi:tetratricopeptide (TPR) repeat protein
MQENNFDRSESLYIQSIEISEKTLDPGDITVLEYTNDLGTLYLDVGKADKAIELFKQSLELAEVNLSTNAPELIGFLTDLSSGYIKVGNYSDAEKLSRRALKIAEKPDPPYDHMTNDHITEPLENLAISYRNQEKFAESFSILNKSLEITERKLGPKHLITAQVQLELAKTLYSSGKITEAEALLKSVLNICQETFSGPSHREAVKTILDLRAFYNKIGNAEEAARAEDILIEFGESMLGTLDRRLKEGHYIKADGDCTDVLKFTEEELASDYRTMLAMLIGIGFEYNEDGKYDKAEPILKCSVEVLEKRTDPPASIVPLILNELSLTYLQQKKYKDAEPLLKRALKLAEKDLKPNDPLLAKILYNRAHLYRSQLKIKEAMPLLMRSIEIRGKDLDANYPDLADSLALMATLHALQDNYTDATLYLEHALKIWKNTRSSDDPLVIGTYKSLVKLYNKTGKPEEAARVEALLEKAGFKVEEE